MPRHTLIKAVLLMAVAVVIVGSFFYLLGGWAHIRCWPPFCRSSSQSTVADSLITTHRIPIRTASVALPLAHDYGALETHDSFYVVASGLGSLYRATASGVFTKLPFSVPVDDREFIKHTGGGKGVQPNSFSVKDLLLLPDSVTGEVRILASHHVWFPDRQCFTLRVSSAIADAGLSVLRQHWRTIFDSVPCTPLKPADQLVRFAGTGAGGRMTKLSGSNVLLAVGDHEFDGSIGTTLPQSGATSYGKTVLLDLSTGSSRIFSLGHRNPQGLITARDGRIWSTEHGPKGGDELNLIQQGGNYGWPIATYGTKYGEFTWPHEPAPDQQQSFLRPVYSWVPSIGISQLIEVDGKQFREWSGDLLVSSLRSMSLYRLRVDGDRVAFAEPIHVGVRIRDLVEHADGTIALLTSDKLMLLRPSHTATQPSPGAPNVSPKETPSAGPSSSVAPDNWEFLWQKNVFVERSDYMRRELVPNARITLNGHLLSTNSWGMRDKEYARTKAPGTFRIALLGPSQTMGTNVSDAEVFEGILENRLNQSRSPTEPAFEILNFSVMGFSLVHQVALLEDRVFAFSPDVVIVAISDTAAFMIQNYLRAVLPTNVALPADLRAVLRPFLLDSLDYDGQPMPFDLLRRAAQKVGFNTRMPAAEFEKRIGLASKSVGDWALRRMYRAIREHHAVPVVLAINPVEPAHTSPAWFLDAARSSGYFVIDFRDFFAKTDYSAYRTAPWDTYPNARGHRLIAERLHTELTRLHLLQPRVAYSTPMQR